MPSRTNRTGGGTTRVRRDIEPRERPDRVPRDIVDRAAFNRNNANPTLPDYPYLPDPDEDSGRTTTVTLNRNGPADPSEFYINALAIDDTLGLLYGRQLVNCKPWLIVKGVANRIFIAWGIADGEIEDGEFLKIADEQFTIVGSGPQTSVGGGTLYWGTPTQDLTIGGTLFPNNIPGYPDTLENTTIFARMFTAAEFNGLPVVQFYGSGRKDIYDTSLDASPGADPTNPAFQQFTTNAALIGAHYFLLMTKTPGGGQDYGVNWDDVEAVRAHCATIISGSAQRGEFNGFIDDDTAEWWDVLDVIAEHGFFVWWIEDGNLRMKEDWVRATADYIIDESNMVPGSFEWVNGVIPYDELPEKTVTIYFDNFDDNGEETPAPSSTINGDERLIDYRKMFGFSQFQQSERHSIKTQNGYNLERFQCRCLVYDEGLVITKWDRIDLSVSILGFVNAQMRAVEPPELVGPFTYRVTMRRYDPLLYSSVVNTVPSSTLTTVPAVNAIPTGPAPTSVTAYNFSSDFIRCRVRFTEVDFVHTRAYVAQVWNPAETEQLTPPQPVVLADIDQITPGPPDVLELIVAVPAQFGNFKVRLAVQNTLRNTGTYGAFTTVTPFVLPTPAAVTNLDSEVLGPTLVGETDAVGVRLKWDPPDYFTWLGFEIEIRRATISEVAQRSITTLSAVERLRLVNSGAAPQIDLNLEAPSREVETGSAGYDSFAYMYHLLVTPYTSTGVRGPTTTYAHGDSLENGGTLIPVGYSGELGPISWAAWENPIDNGDGTITLDWWLVLQNGHNFDYGYGFRINVYRSTAGNVKGDLLNQIFMHVAARGYGNSVQNPGTDDTTPDFGTDPGQDGDLVFQDTFTIAKEANEYRRFTFQLVGPGDQASEEQDMVEGDATGGIINPVDDETYQMPA